MADHGGSEGRCRLPDPWRLPDGAVKRVNCKVLVLGDRSVGKTSWLKQLIFRETTVQHAPTIGVQQFGTFKRGLLKTDANIPVALHFWDSGGGRDLLIPGKVAKSVDLCALVFDVTNYESFESLSHWRDKFLMECGRGPEQRQHFPFVVVGSKSDLEKQRQVTNESASEWCKSMGDIPYFEISSDTGYSVEYVAVKIAQKALGKHTPIYDACKLRLQQEQERFNKIYEDCSDDEEYEEEFCYQPGSLMYSTIAIIERADKAYEGMIRDLSDASSSSARGESSGDRRPQPDGAEAEFSASKRPREK